ncbi:helix-turn-helix domain-containing protein [Laspinema sp. D1]|uniref:Helix-turn-helix domain-containing protein n=1 Tax=Laspinema palackyanum D2a TaxID=2953684 RepID=A0ABT2MW54_9CYAN|nr:helix-turn-helix domain-containing protein [Laspinema sp. D2a]
MNTINNTSTFFSSVLGEVSHPINIIREYRRVLPKSAARIVTALDGWVRTHQKDPKKYSSPEWVYAPADNLAKQIDLCRDTVQRWLTWLVEQGYLVREWARRWPTDRAYKYRIADKLWSAMQFERWNAQPFSVKDDFQAMDSRKPNDGQPTSQQSMPRKPAISYISPKSSNILFSKGPEEDLETGEKDPEAPTTITVTATPSEPHPLSTQHSRTVIDIPAVADNEFDNIFNQLSPTNRKEYQRLREDEQAQYRRVVTDPQWFDWFVSEVVEAETPVLKERPNNVKAVAIAPKMVLQWSKKFVDSQREIVKLQECNELFEQALARRAEWEAEGHQVAVTQRGAQVVVMIGDCDYNVHEFLRKEVGSIQPKEKSGPTAASKAIIEKLKQKQRRFNPTWLEEFYPQ